MLRPRLSDLIAIADMRLAMPRLGSTTFARPAGTDWAWRPMLWRSALAQPGLTGAQSRETLGGEVTLFHDCPHSEVILRQTRNHSESDLAPFGLTIEVFAFAGSFLSLVIELPSEAAEGLRKRHLIRLGLSLKLERPLEIFARLNIRHGPNTEQIVREFDLDGDERFVEFDLAYSRLNERRVERIWIDLIFEGPMMNRIGLTDVTFARYPRADL